MEIQSSIQVSQNINTQVTNNQTIDVDKLFNSLLEENGFITGDFEERKFKNLSFEEAKALQLKLEKDGYFNKGDEDIANIGASLFQATTYTNDDEFNKALFETMKTKEHPMNYLNEINHNLEYSQGRRKFPYPTIYIGEVQGLTNYGFTYKKMSKDEISNINISEFIKFMINTYEVLLSNGLNKEDTQQSIDDLKILDKNYKKQIDEKNATLEYLTRNNRENPLLKKDKL